MSTKSDPDRGDEITTVECYRDTLAGLDKLQNQDENRADVVRAAARALKDAEPERLQVDL